MAAFYCHRVLWGIKRPISTSNYFVALVLWPPQTMRPHQAKTKSRSLMFSIACTLKFMDLPLSFCILYHLHFTVSTRRMQVDTISWGIAHKCRGHTRNMKIIANSHNQTHNTANSRILDCGSCIFLAAIIILTTPTSSYMPPIFHLKTILLLPTTIFYMPKKQ